MYGVQSRILSCTTDDANHMLFNIILDCVTMSHSVMLYGAILTYTVWYYIISPNEEQTFLSGVAGPFHAFEQHS